MLSLKETSFLIVELGAGLGSESFVTSLHVGITV